jgi:hypothetical protein
MPTAVITPAAATNSIDLAPWTLLKPATARGHRTGIPAADFDDAADPRDRTVVHRSPLEFGGVRNYSKMKRQ